VADRQINGAGVAIAAAGAVIVWSGIRNVPVLDAFRDLVMGKAPTPRNKPPFQPIALQLGSAAASAPLDLARGSALGAEIVQQMAKLRGRPYVFGGGHSSPCTKSLDCSGAVSCALITAGAATRTMTTDGLARWGKGVRFADRQPGDVLVWVGGPGGGHTGVVVNEKTMLHTNCAGCGGVREGTYGPSRTGRPTIVRRAA